MNPWINGKCIASPCKNCTDRWVSDTGRCHDSCEKYQQFHSERTAELCKVYRNRNRGCELDAYAIGLMTKYKRKQLRGSTDEMMRKKMK